MIYNKADVIEEYILKLLAQNQNGEIKLKRTDLAEMVSCVPSQISYVLSTRFTSSRGFKVESQRGLGGYIRITVLDEPEPEYDEEKNSCLRDFIHGSTGEEFNFDLIKQSLQDMLARKYITLREAEIIARISIMMSQMEDDGKIDIMDRSRVCIELAAILAEGK